MNKFLIVEAEAYLNGEIANTTLVNLMLLYRFFLIILDQFHKMFTAL